jgi:hypothetical protein
MSAHQTKSQRKASKLKHLAIIHLRAGGTLKVGRKYLCYAEGSADLFLGQPVGELSERVGAMVMP